MDKFVSIWWTNDTDVAAAGDGRQGIQGGEFHGERRRLSCLRRHQDAGHRRRQEPDAGRTSSARCFIIAASSMRCSLAEAIAQAQKITGKKVVSGEDVRRGLENLDLDAARLKALGLDGFAGTVQDDLRRPQQPFRDLRPAVGRREMGQGQRSRSRPIRPRCSRCSTKPPRPTPRRMAGRRAPSRATTSELQTSLPPSGEGDPEGRMRGRARRARLQGPE